MSSVTRRTLRGQLIRNLLVGCGTAALLGGFQFLVSLRQEEPASQLVGVLSLLGALGVFGVLAHFTARRVTRPLAELRDTLRSFALGGHDVGALSTPSRAPREVMDLLDSFTALAQRLDQSYADLVHSLWEQERLSLELVALAGSLEQQVEVRTKELAESENRYRELFEESLGLICRHDLDGKLSMVNPAAASDLGFQKGELIGRNLRDLLSPRGALSFPAYLGAVRAQSRVEGLMEVVTKGGAVRIWHYRNSVVEEPGSASYVLGHAVDITERIHAEKEARRLALHDSLTGLANRALFLDRLEHALSDARRHHRGVAVLYLDLDGFKQVNDGFGHAAGDWVLQETASRLRSALRATDTVARLGGDELGVVLANITAGRAGAIAASLVRSLASGFRYDAKALDVTASVGLAWFPRDADSAEGLLVQADAAMYTAKRAGKNRWAAALGCHPRDVEMPTPSPAITQTLLLLN
jgi:diguanylate cyclase (GGDEF)-like protein/PAS domain S-box-containing protein